MKAEAEARMKAQAKARTKTPDMSHGARLAAYGTVSASLASCGDHRLRELLDAAAPAGSGIGGQTGVLELAGTPVFVKQVPLTDLERRPENARSTANLFGLPLFCHYGIGRIGSPGSGAWRELAVHTMTTDWVLTGDHEGFPLMYHWRVLPGPRRPLPEDLADVERAVAHWGGGPGIRRRIEGLQQSTASLLLFLEHIPYNLHDWLGARIEAGGEAAGRACAMVDSELRSGTSFMNARGLLHFDAHFKNILTDGRRLFFADYGLALASRFTLTRDETAFFRRHRGYDRYHTAAHLVNWLAFALYGYGPEEREAFARTCAQGMPPEEVQGMPPGEVPPTIADIFARYAPIAAAMGDFQRRFQQESRSAPYPSDTLASTAGHPYDSSDGDPSRPL